MKYPFEASSAEIEATLDEFVTAIFKSLESEFLVLPKGEGFIDYPAFEQAFQVLKLATAGFSAFETARLLTAFRTAPLALVVLRTILGFTPSEWAYVASRDGQIPIAQSYARNLDRRVRKATFTPLASSDPRLLALLDSACLFLSRPAPSVDPAKIHRLDKADTKQGTESIRHLDTMGVPYAMLLYERFLGRPFAGHRDSVSGLVGGGLEVAIEQLLTKHGVSYRKTQRAEKVPGFDQTPDFIVPDEFHPQVVIEAKLTEDDGTARDKITRVQHLAELSERGQPPGQRRFEVIACIAGRGFGVRRQAMRNLILATQGKVFTLKSFDRLVTHSALRRFQTVDPQDHP